MIAQLLEGERCRWCGGKLEKTYLTRITLGIEKGDRILWPVLCECGGITVIGKWQVRVIDDSDEPFKRKKIK